MYFSQNIRKKGPKIQQRQNDSTVNYYTVIAEKFFIRYPLSLALLILAQRPLLPVFSAPVMFLPACRLHTKQH